MNVPEFKRDVSDEVATILSSDFRIDVSETRSVPHSSDGAITFPNLDEKTQGTKLIETTVLYVDMRRSTQLSLQHRRQTVAKLYSAFVRAMTRCAAEFRGEVRGIIGDRVMVLFDPIRCFENAIDTAELMTTVCQFVINKHFVHNEVEFGIGIDYGRMLATKTGIRRHGAAQQSYRSLVWLGRPANIASKLTDQANKPRLSMTLRMVNVAYNYGGSLVYREEYPHDFIQNFTRNPLSGLMIHHNPAFHSFYSTTREYVERPATPSVLMTKAVYDGFRAARPAAIELQQNWFYPISIHIPDYEGQVYGGGVIYKGFED